MIRFENVSYAYGAPSAQGFALRDVSLAVNPDEMVAVLGANGSGKSTLARLSNGLLLPGEGAVSVDGVDTTDPDRGLESRAAVGMVFQNPDDQIVATSVEDDVAFGPENLGLARTAIRERVDAAIADVGLEGLERREPHLLSGGQKQRLAIAGALAMRPRYLVFDEPTSMIDSQGRLEVLDVLRRIRRTGTGVLLITHDVAEAADADRVVVLSRGSVAFDGSFAETIADESALAEWGLELPPTVRLSRALRAHGVPIADSTADPVAIADALCR